jgi:hypothetical protein
MSQGIDYGRGMTNVDHTNGIRFGVIPQNDVLQAWSDSSEPVYPENDPDVCECDCCEGMGTKSDGDDVWECGDCDGTGERTADGDSFESEPVGFIYNGEGYRASCGDCGDIFVTRSPYFTHARFCSPCAPGAGHLRDANPDGVRTYCFGHDWFDDGIAPYPVFSVETGELVEPDAR